VQKQNCEKKMKKLLRSATTLFITVLVRGVGAGYFAFENDHRRRLFPDTIHTWPVA
jgi:Holliday junction resolvasome RuvABC DNA-binding subunit